MRQMSFFLSRVCLCLSLFFSSFSYAGDCPDIGPIKDQRYLVAISDLHFGVGRTPDGKWHPTEDFRWTQALTGFLNRISSCGKDAVDLVVAGDVMELWQPPPEILCDGPSEDASCTPEQFLALTKIVTKAHQQDFSAFGTFSDRGSNRVYFIPGNHDAVLLLPGPWDEVKQAIASKSGRVTLVDKGPWVSQDGQVVIEHGHQIGEDVNSYAAWPNILRDVGGKQYVESPWGERFVQKLFNEQELAYPIIDNLSPETAGARYRMADRGLWSSTKDVARFVRFNLFETSLSQKVKALGKNENPNIPPEWDIKYAREKGYKLFASALPPNDPFLLALENSDSTAVQLRAELENSDSKAVQLRAELDVIAKDLPEDEVRLLCDQIAIRSDGKEMCKKKELGALTQSLLFSKRTVLTRHLRARIAQPGLERMRVFVYGHTHQLEESWSLDKSLPHSVKIFNTGAFQRLVDEKGFLARATAKKMTASEALKSLAVEDLAPCYTAVVIGIGPNLPAAKTIRWVMTEDSQEPGYFTLPGDPKCN